MSPDDDPPDSDHTAQAIAGVTAVVLAAGRGKRLASRLPKPAYPICGRAMAAHVLHALAEAGIPDAVVVIPPDEQGELIQRELTADCPGIKLRFAIQDQPHGTAHAVLAAQSHVQMEHALVINGDLPLVTTEQLSTLLSEHDADAVITTTVVDDPAEMGRILRGGDGRLAAIREFRDASDPEKDIKEVNVGIYRFRSDFLWPTLQRIVDAAGANESYITDAIPPAVERGGATAVEIELLDGHLNVETPADAARAESIIARRIVGRLLRNKVHIRDPHAVWIDAQVTAEPGAIIEPGSHLRGRTSIGPGARIGPNAIVEDATVGPDCTLESCTVRDSTLGAGVVVGPYSTVRPGCQIGDRVHIGTHAELKAVRIGDDAQIHHFSYLGDSIVGARANIGAGAVTCNFDGDGKHETIIGDDAFIGSDTMLIAPVSIGARARTGAGAVVTKDVPDDGNAVGHPARLTTPHGDRGNRAARAQEEASRE